MQQNNEHSETGRDDTVRSAGEDDRHLPHPHRSEEAPVVEGHRSAPGASSPSASGTVGDVQGLADDDDAFELVILDDGSTPAGDETQEEDDEDGHGFVVIEDHDTEPEAEDEASGAQSFVLDTHRPEAVQVAPDASLGRGVGFAVLSDAGDDEDDEEPSDVREGYGLVLDD